ncbi:hypothetical protein Mapa_002650 [Marchantia paleacea]|nr:hypothetical protein Mapa_002650 [Marchantia paleacea]
MPEQLVKYTGILPRMVFIFNSKNLKLTRLPIFEGTAPLEVLSEHLLKETGMLPEILLPCKYKKCRSLRLPSSEGTASVKPLCDKSRAFNSAQLGKDAGMGPASELFERSSC